MQRRRQRSSPTPPRTPDASTASSPLSVTRYMHDSCLCFSDSLALFAHAYLHIHADTNTDKEKHRCVCLSYQITLMPHSWCDSMSGWKNNSKKYGSLHRSCTLLHFPAIHNVSRFVLSLHYSLIPMASLTDIELCLLLFCCYCYCVGFLPCCCFCFKRVLLCLSLAVDPHAINLIDMHQRLLFVRHKCLIATGFPGWEFNDSGNRSRRNVAQMSLEVDMCLGFSCCLEAKNICISAKFLQYIRFLWN